jgi:hypothetical protein
MDGPDAPFRRSRSLQRELAINGIRALDSSVLTTASSGDMTLVAVRRARRRGTRSGSLARCACAQRSKRDRAPVGVRRVDHDHELQRGS